MDAHPNEKRMLDDLTLQEKCDVLAEFQACLIGLRALPVTYACPEEEC